MPEARQDWQQWGDRLRSHIEAKGIAWSTIVEGMQERGAIKGDTGSGIRHWLNGTRKINLVDFFSLCEVCQAEPDTILFGGPCLRMDNVSGPLRDAYEALVRLAKAGKR